MISVRDLIVAFNSLYNAYQYIILSQNEKFTYVLL